MTRLRCTNFAFRKAEAPIRFDQDGAEATSIDDEDFYVEEVNGVINDEGLCHSQSCAIQLYLFIFT